MYQNRQFSFYSTHHNDICELNFQGNVGRLGTSFLVFFFYSGALPLRGSIPDMTSDSERYIQLQNAYVEQANKDVAVITDKVNMLTSSLAKVGYTTKKACFFQLRG